jgi:hypothetical protein
VSVFRVTRAISLGPFASPQRAEKLLAAGVTHVLNVGEAPSIVAARAGAFRAVAWHEIADLALIPVDAAAASLRTLHEMACEPDSHVYVHCVAGWNRSPTIVWLYLVACGMTGEAARGMIERAAPDAIPGHKQLVNEALVEAMRELGARELLPHPRPEAIAGV